MPDRYRIQLYWAPRQEGLDGLGRRLFDMLTAFGQAHPQLTGFVRDDGDEDVPVEGREGAVNALEAGRETWAFGREEHVVYDTALHVKRALSPPFCFTLTCGIEPEHVGGLFAPNRLEMWLRRDAPDDLATPEVIQTLLANAAVCWDADFGYVGTATRPPPAQPLTTLGVPPVGWMTFVSKRLPPPPPTLRSPAVTYPVGDTGHIVVAHPSLYREHLKDHRTAIDTVAAALAAAGVLKPSVQLES